MKKNVGIILCHPSDTLRAPAPSHSASANELLLIDNKDGSFEVQSIDSSGEPFDISKAARLQVLASAPNVAEEPKDMTFRLKPSENVIVSVTVTWNQAGPGPLAFQLRTHMVDGDAITVVPVDHVPGDAFIDADIRSTSPTGDLPRESAIRKRANEVRAKRKADIDAVAAKAKADRLPKPFFAERQEPYLPLPPRPLPSFPEYRPATPDVVPAKPHPHQE